MRCRVEVCLLISGLLMFIVSFFGGFDVGIDLAEHWRLVAILEANPNRYFAYMKELFFYFILPAAVGLVFSVVAFVRDIKSQNGILDEWWLLIAFIGGLFFFWGFLGLWATYTSYCDVMRSIESYDSVDIAPLIPSIYATASVGEILWLFAGSLFMLSPVLKIVLHDKQNVLKIEKSSL